MRERELGGIERRTRQVVEATTKVLSFGVVEDMFDDLVSRPPDGNLVRVDTCLKESGGNGGLGLRTASVLITARRGDEVLVANIIHTYYQTMHGRALRENDQGLAAENHEVVKRVLEEQLREQGFTIGRGTYALPDHLSIYRSTSERIVFQERKALARDSVVVTLEQKAGSISGNGQGGPQTEEGATKP